MGMDNRVALVTGGTGGIGTAICRALADLGCRVASVYHTAGKGEKWAAEQEAAGYKFLPVKMDVSNFADCETGIKTIEKNIAPVDILVNCAGITRDGQFRKMTVEQWHDVISTNLNSVFNVTRNVINGMLDRNFGRVINISSINGQKGQFGQCNYSAAKAGLHGFTKALAQEVARKGVTVNTVSPGYCATDMVMAVQQDVRDKIMNQIPVGRFGEPKDIARVVAFLADEAAGFITGADFSANGGMHMY